MAPQQAVPPAAVPAPQTPAAPVDPTVALMAEAETCADMDRLGERFVGSEGKSLQRAQGAAEHQQGLRVTTHHFENFAGLLACQGRVRRQQSGRMRQRERDDVRQMTDRRENLIVLARIEPENACAAKDAAVQEHLREPEHVVGRGKQAAAPPEETRLGLERVVDVLFDGKDVREFERAKIDYDVNYSHSKPLLQSSYRDNAGGGIFTAASAGYPTLSRVLVWRLGAPQARTVASRAGAPSRSSRSYRSGSCSLPVRRGDARTTRPARRLTPAFGS